MPDEFDEAAPAPEDRPRETEARSYAFEFEARATSDGLTLDGYAAVFNQPADIVDHRGRYVETIERGAFRKTLQENKPAVLFEHGRHPLIGTMPIAQLTKASEDSRGLHVRARVFDNWMTRPIVDAIQGRAIEGMSIQMQVTREAWSADRAERSVHEVKLIEVSPVLQPAYAGTSVSLRSIIALTEIDDEEIRAAFDAARSGTSIAAHSTALAAAALPEPDPDHSVPQETIELWLRARSRRRIAA